MPTVPRAIAFIALILVFHGCTRHDSGAAPPPAAAGSGGSAQPAAVPDGTRRIFENQKYRLQCVFHVDQLKTETDRVIAHVSGITIKDQRGGREAAYVPVDHNDSLDTSQGYFEDVWSPNEEYLLLPAGRFEGFCIIKASEAIKNVEERECTDSIRVEQQNGVRLWHQFRQWEGGASFSFKVGLSGDDFVVRYDLMRRQLTALEKIGDSFIGVNGAGRVRLSDTASHLE